APRPSRTSRPTSPATTPRRPRRTSRKPPGLPNRPIPPRTTGEPCPFRRLRAPHSPAAPVTAPPHPGPCRSGPMRGSTAFSLVCLQRLRLVVTLLDAVTDDALPAPAFAGPSWKPWHAFLSAVDALPLSGAALDLYRRCTGRQRAPTTPAREVYAIVGRR